MKDSDNLVIVPLKSSDPEYFSVIKRFQNDAGKKDIIMVRVVFLHRTNKDVLDRLRLDHLRLANIITGIT